MMDRPERRMIVEDRRGREGGFSLLEVLAAFVVLALVLSVLLRLLGTSVRSSALTADYAEATRRAETLLAAAEIDSVLQPGSSTGTLDERWRWRRAVTLYKEPGREFNAQSGFRPMHVEIEVLWNRDGRERSVSLSTLRIAKVQ